MFRLQATGDIRLSGHVSWVGNSTMEVVVWLEQKDQNSWQKLTRALFLMAARDSLNKRAAFVNKLVPASDHEAKILQGGEGTLDDQLIILIIILAGEYRSQ